MSVLALHAAPHHLGCGRGRGRVQRRPPSTAIASIPGVWGHLPTFLGGPHAYIGCPFFPTEMKPLVFTLKRGFEFEFGVPAKGIMAIGDLIQLPGSKSGRAKGAQLLLLIRPGPRVALLSLAGSGVVRG
ncbi:uncharacterized protein BXZ73DRAFT_105438 [Epithele typhae]|uniref:uncharacterized protein n=1 Tax=Epithele typhae TaxID=378194 RepID=UPI0020086A29|nr:uncharacterized protein BXZ73DRAFT_105438 [Epithele typhae]KAH9917918.1 hypothetical protein BXZ73DRAFT_105438 [Epithele typhae]